MPAEPSAQPPGATSTPRTSKPSSLFAIDLRSLAFFRIGLGLLLLIDIWGRTKTLRIHYTVEGVYPGELAGRLVQPDLWLFRVFLMNDSVEFQALLFGIFALLALAFLLGWHTRVVSVLCWVLLVSLVRRNHWACHTGDVWLQTLFFWTMFLPLGAQLSLDRLRGRTARPPGASVLSVATFGVLLQIVLFYLMAGFLKARYDIWTEGRAVWIFTQVIEYTRPFGAWLGQYPTLCRFMTYGALVLEGVAPFLLFSPFWTARLRVVLVFLFAGFHLTLQTAIHIGIFQMMCLAALGLFLPGSFWDGLGRRLPAGLRELWRGLRSSIAARFGKTPVQHAPGPLAILAGRSLGVLLSLALVVILVSNANSVVKDPYDRQDRGPLPLPVWLDEYGRQFCIVQSWNMFTDIESVFVGWFLVLGQQVDGSVVNVLEGGPVELQRPEHYATFFPNHNSRRYWRAMAVRGRDYLQQPMSAFLAREWQAAGNPALTHLSIFQIGRVPSDKRKNDQVRNVCTWEAPHRPLAEVTPEERERWQSSRTSWRRFLEEMPRVVQAPR
jgi:hypothetical protein